MAVQVERADGATKKGQRDCKVDRVQNIGSGREKRRGMKTRE